MEIENELIDFDSIDAIISLNSYEKKEINKIELNDETKRFVERIINKYNKYARDRNFDINTSSDERRIIFTALLELFPNDQSKLYKDIKEDIETNNYKLFFKDKWKLQNYEGLQLVYDD